MTFARNEVLACEEITGDVNLNGPFHYEHKDGKLIYALVKAEKEENALTIAGLIVKQVRTSLFGNDNTN